MKKRFELFKINNKIRRISGELIEESKIGPSSISGYIYQAPMSHQSFSRGPESERAVILRRSMNGLIEKRAEIRSGK